MRPLEFLSIGTAAIADAIPTFPAVAVGAARPSSLVGEIRTVAIGATGLVPSLSGRIVAVTVGDAARGRSVPTPTLIRWIGLWPAVAIRVAGRGASLIGEICAVVVGVTRLVVTVVGAIRGIGIRSTGIGLRPGLTRYERQCASRDCRSADDPCHEGPAIDVARHSGLPCWRAGLVAAREMRSAAIRVGLIGPSGSSMSFIRVGSVLDPDQ